MNASTWTERAACADRLDLPWTHDAADVHPLHALTMAHICQACPVVLDCLAAVDDLDVTGGFWAGQDRDPDAASLAQPPAWALPDPDANARGPVASGEPLTCWIPRRSHGTPYEQGAFVLQSADAGVWHLGGVAS